MQLDQINYLSSYGFTVRKLQVLDLILLGGAFCVGGNSKRIYKGVNLVEHSLACDEPVVYVALNYRVNYFGFLASKELAKDNAAHGGGVGNYGYQFRYAS